MKNLLLIITAAFLFSSSAFAQEYVGSENCVTCHSGMYNDWIDSGHPYKFNVVPGDSFPHIRSLLQISRVPGWIA